MQKVIQTREERPNDRIESSDVTHKVDNTLVVPSDEIELGTTGPVYHDVRRRNEIEEVLLLGKDDLRVPRDPIQWLLYRR